MSKGLEALERLRKGKATNSDVAFIKKELKALEIIRKKKVDAYHEIWECRNYKEYMELYDTYDDIYILTKEEFALLKEVL